MGSPVAVHPFFHGPPTPRYRSANDSQIQAEGVCKPFRGKLDKDIRNVVDSTMPN